MNLRVAVCGGVLQIVAVYCSVLQCIAVYCSVLQGVAVCCNVLQCVSEKQLRQLLQYTYLVVLRCCSTPTLLYYVAL